MREKVKNMEKNRKTVVSFSLSFLCLIILNRFISFLYYLYIITLMSSLFFPLANIIIHILPRNFFVCRNFTEKFLVLLAYEEYFHSFKIYFRSFSFFLLVFNFLSHFISNLPSRFLFLLDTSQ